MRRGRAFSPTVAALLCAVWLAGAVHQLAPHVYCAVHHAFEEWGEAAPAPIRTTELVACAPASALGAAHEACPLAAPQDDRVPAVHLAPSAVVVPDAHQGPRDQVSVPPIPILSNAPKSSPPVSS